jgi:hypothetical protein
MDSEAYIQELLAQLNIATRRAAEWSGIAAAQQKEIAELKAKLEKADGTDR